MPPYTPNPISRTSSQSTPWDGPSCNSCHTTPLKHRLRSPKLSNPNSPARYATWPRNQHRSGLASGLPTAPTHANHRRSGLAPPGTMSRFKADLRFCRALETRSEGSGWWRPHHWWKTWMMRLARTASASRYAWFRSCE
jgi:hypothetical protein